MAGVAEAADLASNQSRKRGGDEGLLAAAPTASSTAIAAHANRHFIDGVVCSTALLFTEIENAMTLDDLQRFTLVDVRPMQPVETV